MEMASGDRGASAGVDKLKEPCTNAADRMMLVRHRGGNRVMIWRGLGRFLGGRRFWQQPLQRILGRATEFVEPVAGRAARLLEAADAWVGDGVRRASSGADGGRLLEHFPSSGLNRFKQ